MLIGPPIPEMQLFKKLTLKIQGQDHGWRQSWKSQCESNILSTHIPFVRCQSCIPLLSYDFFKLWNSSAKVIDEVIVQIRNVGITSYRLTSISFHVNRPSYSWDTAFPKFGLENQGSRWGHNTGLASYRLASLSCHVNRPSYSWDTAFSKFDLENQWSRSWVRSQCKSQWGSNILSTHTSFVPCQSAIPFLKYSIFKIWPWKSRVKVKWSWCCTTTGLDNSIELRMAKIHPTVSKIWVPQMLAQVLPDLTSFWPMGKPIWGKRANNYDSAQLQV